MTLPKMLGVKETNRSGSSSSSSSENTATTTASVSASTATVVYRGLNLEDEFELIRTLAEGCFAKVVLAKKGSEKLVLKAVHSEVSSEEDFLRELHYNYFLSPHPNIVTSYNVSFGWENCFVFVQEYAPFGDLSRFVKKGGLPEAGVKLVGRQIGEALDFMHSLNLVHRDLKLENILVFKPNLSQLKLCDFGYTRPEGTLVTKTLQTWIPFSPPEVCQVVTQERYYCAAGSDVWQLGILLYVCLTGSAPWQVADITDPAFCHYLEWVKRKSLRMPEAFKAFTPRFLRLLKRLLEPKAGQRYEAREILKYLDDDWTKRCGGSRSSNNSSSNLSGGLERKESSNTASRSSQNKPKRNGCQRSKSCRGLRNYGIETEIDKNAISERVVNWISSSTKNTKYFWDKL